ncbi:hypothetical protein [Croceibacter atlanticus]|uniref:hypothetical protein n=1 Tax=Croceibacter atlanticus TaxID=313588 RepID=UPI0024BA4210|nr:hypothetical protein [Croceibacter atlanticus]
MNSSIDKIIAETPIFEDSKTLELFEYFDSIKEQGFLTKEQGLRILKWKSPRPLKHYKKNSNEDFKKITKLAFQQKDEKLKIHILTALVGVKYPSASAILMFLNQDYPVLDIRVWKQLYNLKYVTTNPNGLNFSLEEWNTYLKVIRSIASEYNTNARQIEKQLFDFDKANQIGNLY